MKLLGVRGANPKGIELLFLESQRRYTIKVENFSSKLRWIKLGATNIPQGYLELPLSSPIVTQVRGNLMQLSCVEVKPSPFYMLTLPFAV